MTPPSAVARPLPSIAGLPLAVPARPLRDIGEVISSPAAAALIAGVAIETGVVWPDDRGCFSEIFRFHNADFTLGFAGSIQVSAAISFAGTVKAFHYHQRQTDLWAPIAGHFQLVLIDFRRESATFGGVNTIYAGAWRPWRLRLPPGVAHGYKILGHEPGVMVYATDRFYDPTDEGRIPYDDQGLKYDWDTQHK